MLQIMIGFSKKERNLGGILLDSQQKSYLRYLTHLHDSILGALQVGEIFLDLRLPLSCLGPPSAGGSPSKVGHQWAHSLLYGRTLHCEHCEDLVAI